jgi:hypothetical protein
METLVPSKNKTAVGRHQFRVLKRGMKKRKAPHTEEDATLPQPGNHEEVKGGVPWPLR